MNGYLTVDRESSLETVIQKSRFIGQCFPVTEEKAATAILDQIRKRYWDATHNCYAYCIGSRAETARSSDDGEPSGTAGMPILQVLTAKGLTNTLCIVTRYFGGVLLGAGGLIRAYSGSAAASIDSAGIVHMLPCTDYILPLPYPVWASIEHSIRRESTVNSVEYSDHVQVLGHVPETDTSRFCAFVQNVTDGRSKPVFAATEFRAVKTEDRFC